MAVADITTFDLQSNQKAVRKLLVTAVNVGDSIDDTSQGAAPIWQVVGAGVEDSEVAFNPATETVTAILGVTETTVNKFETSQSLDPMTVRGGSTLAVKLYNQVKYNRYSEFPMYEVMLIYGYAKRQDGSFEAEVHKGCTLTPQSVGGSAYVDMPIDINFSNNKVHGTVNSYLFSDTITFTADS